MATATCTPTDPNVVMLSAAGEFVSAAVLAPGRGPGWMPAGEPGEPAWPGEVVMGDYDEDDEDDDFFDDDTGDAGGDDAEEDDDFLDDEDDDLDEDEASDDDDDDL